MQFLLNDYPLTVKKTSRKGSVALKVTPSENALLVPNRLSKKQIQQLVEAQWDWLVAKIEAQQSALPERISLVDVNEILLFGERITFQWQPQLKRKRAYIQFDSQQLTVWLPETEDAFQNEALLKKALSRFYIQQLEPVLMEMIALWQQRIEVTVTEVQIKDYKARWGSCYADGRVQFNWRLALAPLPVIEYVVVHELCHLIYQNHSKAYWQLVAHHCPNYQTQKAWLKQQGAALMDF